jgi:class 3 adenylate cyclase
MSDLPSGTVTFLFSDIEGSTALLRRLRDRYGEVLGDHHRLLRAAFTEAGGTEIDSQGDAFFFCFRRARDAVRAAVAAARSGRTRMAGGHDRSRPDGDPHRRGVADR